MVQLTDHFSASEFGLADTDTDGIRNAKALCLEVLEPVREHYSLPLQIHDGKRCEAHNAAVGGKKASYHLFEGGRCAADFHVIGVNLRDTFDWIRLKSKLGFDKVILEHDKNGVPRCIHVQLDIFSEPRRQAFEGETGNATSYLQVTVL